MGLLIARLLASDMDGFLFLGNAGEFAQFSTAEHKGIAEFCTPQAGGRHPVIIGTASCATDMVIELSQHASGLGADTVMIDNPYYARLTEERIYIHYQRIAEASPLLALLYNCQALTGQDLSIEQVTRLARDCSNILGNKDTVDCMSHIRRIIFEVKAMRPDFLVFCGFDKYMLDTLLLVGDGVIPASSNFAPEISCGIYKAFCKGDFPAIQTLMRRLAALSKIYSTDTSFTGLIKEALRMTGSNISTYVFSPATPPDAAMELRLKEILERAGLLPT